MQHATLQKLIPALPVENVNLTVDFYCNKLGFSHPWFYGDPAATDGGCRRDDVHIMFCLDAEKAKLFKGFSLLVFVHKIESLFDEMANKEITISTSLKKYEHGMQEFAIEDCNGYIIRFAENHH